jgi:hypothetical protein
MALATRLAMSNFATIDLASLDAVTGGADDAPQAPTFGQELGSAAKRCVSGAAVGAVAGGAIGAVTTGGPGVLPGAGLGAAAGCVRGIVNKVNPAY